MDDNVQLSLFPSERFVVEEDTDQERFVIKYIYLSRDTLKGSRICSKSGCKCRFCLHFVI